MFALRRNMVSWRQPGAVPVVPECLPAVWRGCCGVTPEPGSRRAALVRDSRIGKLTSSHLRRSRRRNYPHAHRSARERPCRLQQVGRWTSTCSTTRPKKAQPALQQLPDGTCRDVMRRFGVGYSRPQTWRGMATSTTMAPDCSSPSTPASALPCNTATHVHT